MIRLVKYLTLLVTLSVPASLLASIGAIPTASIEQSSVRGIDTTQIQVKKQKFKRGAKGTSKEIRDALPKHVVRTTTPATYMVLPTKLSMWLNDTYGDCVTAEEAFAKATQGIFISDSTVQAWATANGTLNGANLPPVLQQMATSGFAQDSNTYNDGTYTTVDQTNWGNLTNAISIGPVKIGIASSQFDNVPGVGEQNGWIMSGFQQDSNEDHCVSLCGYGTMTQLCGYFNVTPPANAETYTQCLALFTWSTVGIIDFQSMQNITQEAYLRTPENITVGSGTPAPDSVTIFGGTPVPPPIPPPTTLPTITTTSDLPAGTYQVVPSGTTIVPPGGQVIMSTTTLAELGSILMGFASEKKPPIPAIKPPPLKLPLPTPLIPPAKKISSGISGPPMSILCIPANEFWAWPPTKKYGGS